MPTDEHSRTEYLRSLLNQQRKINANGGNLLNPAIPNMGGSLGAAASMDTSMQGGGINPDVLSYDPEKDVKQKNWFESAVDKIFGFADEIAAQFGAGFVGAFEGILDLAATGLGALGEGTGWYSSDPFKNWAKKDLGGEAATYIKTYLTPWNDVRNMINGNYWTEDYWRGRGMGALNVLSLGTAFDDQVDFDKDHDKYYGFNDNLETGFGQFLGGAAHSIGFMLPSIMTGGAAAAASGSSAVAQGASLASMGVSAAGKGGEEALNEGASAGQALAYGAASGAVEVVSEVVVGKALGLVGLGTGKVMGVIGKGAGAKTASVGSKTFVKELVKTMNEEGAEEIFSAVMEPLTKAIYKGGVDVKDTYGNADWWFGTNGRFNESVLGQYASGAFVGGLSGGIQNSAVYKKVGKNGYQLVAESRNVAEAIDGLQKAEKGTSKYAKAEQKFGDAMSAFIKAENTFLESATKDQKIEIAKVFSSPNNMKAFTEALQAADVDASVSDYIKRYTENISTADKAVSYNFLSQMQRKYGTDVELRFDESIKANGQYDAGTNTITLNPKVLSTKGGKVLAHEYFGHALSSNMSAGTRAQFYQQIKSIDPSLVKQVEDTYKEIDKSSPKMREEVISHFLERYFDDANISKQLDKVNKAFGDMTLKERILQAFDKTAKQQKGRAIIKEYGRVLREFLKKSGDKNLLKAAAKSVLKQPLTENEKKAAKAYPSVFDVLKNAMTGRQAEGVFASSELSSVDSNGNKLTPAQQRFFKDSKVVDGQGNLMVVYHTTNADFSVFDKSLRGSNTGVSDAKWGFFFATSNDANVQKQFGDKTKQFYLNITNPLDLDLFKKIPSDASYDRLSAEEKKVVDAIASLMDASADDVLSNASDIEAQMEFREELSSIGDVDEKLKKLGFDGIKDFLSNSTDGSKTPIYEYVAFDSNQIKSLDNKAPTENENIYLSKDLDEDYEKHPEKDPEGYFVTSDGRKIGLTNHLGEAIAEMENDGINVSDYLVGETDYKDGYISKRFVNRANRNAEALRSAIENKFGDDFSDLERWLEDHSEEEYQDFLKFVEENVNEDTADNIANIGSEVDQCEYPNDEPPSYDEIETLCDLFSSMQEAAENWPEDYKEKQWRDALPGGDWHVAFFHQKGEHETMSRMYESGNDIDQIKDDMVGNGMVLDAVYSAKYKEVGTYSRYAHGQESSYYEEIERMRDEGQLGDGEFAKEKLVEQISKVARYEKIREWKLFDKLTLTDLKAIDRISKGEALSHEELMSLPMIQEAESYNAEHDQLKVSDNLDLVAKVKDEFRSEYFTDKYGKGRKVMMVTGLPSAGKSTGVLKKFMEDNRALEFDNDIMKKAKGIAKYYDGGKGANTVQPIVSVAQEQLFPEMLKAGYNFVYPAVGKKTVKVINELQAFRDSGYEIELVHITVPNLLAQARALIRYASSGRYVSLEYINGIGSQTEEAYNEIEEKRKNGELKGTDGKTINIKRSIEFDNSGSGPKIIRDSQEEELSSGGNRVDSESGAQSELSGASGLSATPGVERQHADANDVVPLTSTTEEIARKYNGEATLETRETTEFFSEENRREYADLRSKAKQLLDNDSRKPWKTSVRTRGTEKFVNIAPYYMANVTTAEDYRGFRENFRKAQNMLAKIARSCGCDFVVRESFGIYENQADKFFQNEPSFVVSLGKVDMDTANYVASLFADLGFQQQEASISSRVVRTFDEWKKIDPDNRAIRFEVRFDQYVIKPHSVATMFQQRGIECTVRSDGIVQILDFNSGYQTRAEIEKTKDAYKEVYDILKERKAVHGQTFKEAIRYYLVESRWLGKDSRRELYEGRSRRSGEEGLGVAEQSSAKTGRTLLAASAPASTAKPPVKQYYKSIETTRDIVTDTGNLIVDLINNGGAYDYRIVYPDDFRDTASVGMTKINSVKDTAKEAHRLVEVMSEAYIEERNADGTYTTFGTVADIIDPSVLASLEPYVESVIKSAPDTEARSRATRSLEMQLNRALDKNRDLKSKVVRTRVLTNQRNTIKDMVDRYVQVTDEVRAKEGLYTLLQPFGELHGSSSDAFQRRGFKGNLRAALEWYTEENMNDPDKWVGIPFDPEVRQALIDVYESLGESEKGSLSTETMRLSSRAINLVRQLIRKMRSDYTVRIRPAVDQTYAAIEASGYRKHKNIVAKLYRMYKRGFAPAYVILNQMLGDNSVLAKKLTFDMQKALNDAQLYRGGYGDAINKKLKELGLKKTFDKKRFSINGKSLSADQAMFLWNALNTQANFDAINDAGITYYDENNNLAKVSEVGKAQSLKDELERVLPENYKKMAEFLLDTMNGSVKSEYMKMYEDRYGKYEHRNEIGKIGDRSYWMLFRSYERITNTEKAVKNPAGMFSHALKRVNNENAVLIAGALSSFTAYTDQLSRELFVKPTYREALSILNSKGGAGQNVAMLLRQKVDEQDYHYLTNTLSDVLGANPFDKGNDIFSRAMSAFSVAKLSLNIGTMLKQFASIWTSNIPMTKSVKGVFSNIFKSSAVRSEYRALVDELGGLKYRESGKGVVLANADSAGAFTQKIASVGMIGISKVDLFTVSSGVVSLMHIAKDQFDYEIGTEENKQWVKDHWTEFELSQIGGGALSKNAIQRGDFKQLPRLLFGFMQGANRAALGSQLNKIGLWKRNHNVDAKALSQEKADAKAARDKAKTAYEAQPDDKGLAKAYMDAESRFLDAEAKLNDYERFRAAGGNAIPVHMASGLIAQGLFISLINELMKHLRGKKDKDDWEFVKDPILWLLNTAKTIGLDWLPFVNAITSALLGSFERDASGNIKVGKGYELSVPVVEMGNALIDIWNNVKEGKPDVWAIATLAGDMLGIPADLIKDYVRGAIRWFDPVTANKVQNVLYGSSLQSATKTYQTFLDKGDSKSAKSMLKSMFAQYKTGYLSDSVADRIVKLEMNGYDVDVKSAMTAYTGADGARVQLDARQINAFKEAYSKSDRVVAELMSTGEFQSSTQEEQASLIKKIYDSYYAYAKAKATGQSDTKVSALLAGTNGTVAVGRFIAMLSKISSIKANKVKSRKELVFDFLSGKGLSRAEKTLVLYLAGYGLNDNSKKTLSTYLLAKGMSRNAINDFLGK